MSQTVALHIPKDLYEALRTQAAKKGAPPTRWWSSGWLRRSSVLNSLRQILWPALLDSLRATRPTGSIGMMNISARRHTSESIKVPQANSLFIDTAGWGCYIDRSHPLHHQAVSEYQRSVAEKWVLVTTNYVIVELVALLKYVSRASRHWYSSTQSRQPLTSKSSISILTLTLPRGRCSKRDPTKAGRWWMLPALSLCLNAVSPRL